MFLAMEHQIRMYFVRNHQHVIGMANLKHLLQLLFRPYDPKRIMGAAQKKDFHIRVFCFLLKICKINCPFSILFNQLVFNYVSFPCLCNIVELRIHGSLNHNRIPFPGKHLDNCRQCRYNSQAPAYFFLVNLPAMPAELPAKYCIKIGVRPICISPDPFHCFFHACIDDWLCRLEIHICDPKRNHIRGTKLFLPLIVFSSAIFTSVNYDVKIILHMKLLSVLYLYIEQHTCQIFMK